MFEKARVDGAIDLGCCICRCHLDQRANVKIPGYRYWSRTTVRAGSEMEAGTATKFGGGKEPWGTLVIDLS